jgi:putative tryptophan/tyrosine transport system substrate-binding protein
MKASILLYALLALLLATVHLAEAQQAGKIPRIGYLLPADERNTPGLQIEALRQGLRDLGYIEGKNVLIEYRYAEGKRHRRVSLLNELFKLNVDVLVLVSIDSIRAAKQAAKTPVVMIATVDPVALGLVDSFAHPGGNVTGLTTLIRDLSGKRLELLKEALPGISRVGVLWDAANEGATISFKEYEATAPALKIQLQSLEVRGPNPDLEGAFQAAAKGRANALVVISSGMLNGYRKQIGDLVIKNRLPSMHEQSFSVDAGGLMSYSADDGEIYRRAGVFVGKILRGAKPADLPVEQPKKFEFLINLKTAKQIGVTISPNVLARADKVIK